MRTVNTETDIEDETTAVREKCPGLKLVFPLGKNGHTSYPFGLHDTGLPWSYRSAGDDFFLREVTCAEGALNADQTECERCNSLSLNKRYKAIVHRIEHGVHENSTLIHQPVSGLIEIVHRYSERARGVRLMKLNDTVTIGRKMATIDAYKELTMAIASDNMSQVSHVLQAGLNNGAGVYGLIGLLRHGVGAAHGAAAMSLGLLFLRLGGSRVAEIAHRALGLPSVSTLRRHTTICPLIPSPGMPTVAEIEANIEATRDATLPSTGPIRIMHGGVLLDEVATERRGRYDDRNNKAIGICRQHSHKLPTELNSEADLEVLCAGLKAGDAHLAGEATVAALGAFSSDPREYLVQPLNPTLLMNGTTPTYLFESAELLVITATLYEHLLPRTEFVENIPTVGASVYYPYRFGGQACFVCQGYEDEIDLDQSIVSCCPKCGPSVPLDLTKAPRQLEHFGAHQLHDPTVNQNHEPCGLCGRAAPMCSFYLSKGRASNAAPTIDWTRSTCRRKIIFQYAHAAKSNIGSSPCSNVPVICPICGPTSQAVWKYNLETHLRNFHKLTDPAPHLVAFEISMAEKSALEGIWKNRVPPPKQKRNHGKSKPLPISLAHSTIAILRGEDDTAASINVNTTMVDAEATVLGSTRESSPVENLLRDSDDEDFPDYLLSPGPKPKHRSRRPNLMDSDDKSQHEFEEPMESMPIGVVAPITVPTTDPGLQPNSDPDLLELMQILVEPSQISHDSP
ncbi:hypothetical protein K438DRAFT_2136827, partial [Mycena galopus ATCC 62051]